MELVIIICATLVTCTLLIGTFETIEKCSYYKWRAKNPEAFRPYTIEVPDKPPYKPNGNINIDLLENVFDKEEK